MSHHKITFCSLHSIRNQIWVIVPAKVLLFQLTQWLNVSKLYSYWYLEVFFCPLLLYPTCCLMQLLPCLTLQAWLLLQKSSSIPLSKKILLNHGSLTQLQEYPNRIDTFWHTSSWPRERSKESQIVKHNLVRKEKQLACPSNILWIYILLVTYRVFYSFYWL